MQRQILNLAHQEKTIIPALRRHAMSKQFEFVFIKRDLFKLTVTFLCFLVSGLSTAQDLQSWSVKIDDGAQRFQILAAFNNEAVLDKETQLVWKRAPNRNALRWNDALRHCQNTVVGGRMGWRLPSISEASSLLDGTVSENYVRLAFPINHPFIIDFEGPSFWSIDKKDAKNVWIVNATQGGQIHWDPIKGYKFIAWCVRSS